MFNYLRRRGPDQDYDRDLHHDHDLRERALRLGLQGLLANWDEVKEARLAASGDEIRRI